MNLPLVAVAAICFLAGSAAFAQQPAVDAPNPDGPSAARGPRWNRNRTAQPADNTAEPANPELQPAALLERAYAISRDLPLENRASLLVFLLDIASRIEPQLAETWADELFNTAHDLSDPQQRGRAQVSAVHALARIDADHALEIFRQMDSDSMLDPDLLPVDPRTSAAEGLFPGLLRQKGIAALPVLQQEAQRLAQGGNYPYSAMAVAAVQLAHTDRSLAERIFADGVAAYQQSTPTLLANNNFITMLLHAGSDAQRSDLQQAVTTVVNNLLSHPVEGDESFRKMQNSVRGLAVENPTDYLLMQLLPVISRSQPELLDQIVQSRPALGKSVQSLSTRGVNFSARQRSASSVADPDRAVVTRIQDAASSNPQQALVASNQLQDPAVRAQALSAVASGMASKDPQQAAQLLSDAQDVAAKIDDKRKQLQAIVAMAQAGNRINNQAVLRDSLARGFALGNELLQLDQDAHPDQPPSYSFLAPLVRAGAHTQLETLIAGIEGIQNLQVKAQLLVLTAQSMPRPRRPSRPQTAAGSVPADKSAPPTE